MAVTLRADSYRMQVLVNLQLLCSFQLGCSASISALTVPRFHREDTAQHTLAECVAWEEQRRVLTNEVGGDLSLPAVVRRMVGSAESWDAVVSFCDDVMSQKETAEREREISTTFPGRRRRTGRRRRADNALFRPP